VGTDGKPVLLYRGYSIYDLIKGLFEESVYLLLEGELPNKAQLATFSQQLKEHGCLDEPVLAHLCTYPDNVQMMDLLFTTLSFARFFDEEYHNPLWQKPHENPQELAGLIVRTGVRMGAMIPAIIAGGYRIRNGLPVIRPVCRFPFLRLCDADKRQECNLLTPLAFSWVHLSATPANIAVLGQFCPTA